ncbi:prephenate dehydrogenase [Caldanaerobius fijiensis DSM 17918]|uniref:Prephenate dehydrogenase n=1 Tax=Caldanaerobius fijiensis DSM 17918 TaxID=1121256 RepID=A0A1M5BEV1_9THEO|nr:prephenate dehydrogenase/arogenate dehydrogenase family protein [Caldanaerobius fijiensis]SHF40958.1 prephenate dehydrogenase [Caldanaerobius fijiensis DSM 17918]
MNIGIIGLGLIGGSLAKAIKAHTDHHVWALDINVESLKEALAEGAIDEYRLSLGDSGQTIAADVVFVCTPVNAVYNTVKAVAERVRPGTVITDVCSVKGEELRRVSSEIPDDVYFISGHPMAGLEKGGYNNSSKDLLKGCTYLLLPDGAPDEKVEMLISLVSAIGARPLLIDPDYHDVAVAVISHMPHVISAALLNLTMDNDKKGILKEIAAGSFRDLTRISSSSPEMWKDVCLRNKKEIARAIKMFEDTLEHFRAMLEEEKEEDLAEFFLNAKNYRERVISCR